MSVFSIVDRPDGSGRVLGAGLVKAYHSPAGPCDVIPYGYTHQGVSDVPGGGGIHTRKYTNMLGEPSTRLQVLGSG